MDVYTENRNVADRSGLNIGAHVSSSGEISNSIENAVQIGG